MSTSSLERMGVVAGATLRGAFVGRRGIGLGLVAAVYPVLVLAIAAARRSDIDLLAASELLYSQLFLPVLLLLVCLVLGVSLFRGEIEDDTIVYPVMRSLPRWELVGGKYVGFLVAANLFLVPAALLGIALGILLNLGPAASTAGVGTTVLLTTPVAIAAYGAFFLFLGLVSRQALVIGLIYGFLWETFVPELPGPLKELTLVYYLRAIGAQLAADGPFTMVSAPVSLALGLGIPVLSAVAMVIVSGYYIEEAELRAAPTPA